MPFVAPASKVKPPLLWRWQGRPVAQLAEQRSPKPQVGGSIPSWPANTLQGHRALMNTNVETGSGFLDTVKLALAAAILIGGIVAFYVYEEQSLLVSVAAVLVAVGIAVAVFMQTERGRILWKFIQGSRVELRKIIWPTRQETLQTALTVMVFALILGLFFWGLDFFLLWITRLLTGYGE
jgi:preprotein translocase subunit SecE